MFNPVSNQPNFSSMEKDILATWETEGTFAASLEQRRGNPEFVFYDGPPFATGLPHYGHLLAGTIKDVIPRYQTMRGKFVERVFGWDCHGLPVEYEMEKELQLSGKKAIMAHGVDKFNESCRGIVLRYTDEWETVVRRMGRWVDFRNGYRTMDRDYMESIWWVFRQLWDQGLIYEGHKILPYCPRCETPLSNFEANQGYAEVEDPAITVRFRDAADPTLCYLAWTTTPWTLPSNLALMVGPDIPYVKVRDGETCYILAESRLSAYYRDPNQYEIVARCTGRDLAGARYRPLFPYFANLADEGAFRIVTADFVSTEDGTGIVHSAPGFGEDDALAAQEHGLPEVCPVDDACCFTEPVTDYLGRPVKDADADIIRRLKAEGALVHRGTIRHNYPHCWRDDAPLIYRAISTWFVRIEPLKERMLAANRRINWVPEHLRDGRFGKWLENARDWAISRNRFWGCPLPIWRNADTGETVCIGSVAELEQLCGRSLPDIHKHFVDVAEIPSPTGRGVLQRIPEVLDCWFESGSMPYAQHHYPFADKAHFEANFPAEFIAEGLDQTRGWFYTLVVLGTALFDQAPFRNVVVNGLVLAEDGQKMSKRKRNFPDPAVVIDTYGADAIRLFLLGSPVVRAEDLRFSEGGVRDALRQVLIPLWNAYSFFVTYARLDGWIPAAEPAPPTTPANPLDRWILSSLAEMVEEIRVHMDAYQLQKAANRFEKFVDDLTNWYIRRSRRRFWKSQDDQDKDDAYRTLHFVLLSFCKTAAPFIPFITDTIYRNLRTAAMPTSVHLCDYPLAETGRRDPALERQMDLAMTVVSLGRHLRTEHSLRVRQPLRQVMIVSQDPVARELLAGTADLIAEELNVKQVTIQEHERGLVTRQAKANFKTLGKRLGKEMKEAAASIVALSDDELGQWQTLGAFTLTLPSGTVVELGPEDVLIDRQEKPGLCAATDAGITVALDITLDRALAEEGFAREFISRIQNYRKESGLEVADRIEVVYSVPAVWVSAVSAHRDYIAAETLAVSLTGGEPDSGALATEIAGEPCRIAIRKVE